MTAARRKRVGIIALLQESNTFLAGRTTLDHFRADLLATGPAVREKLAEAHHEVGGFFAGLAAAEIEAIPIFAARALPFGTMTADCLESLIGMMTDALDAAGPLDGLLVAPHGATVSEEILDVDGHWLGLLRRRFPTLPIIGTIDPHANLSPAMIAATDALIAYRTNPHVDQRDRGFEAARLMARTLAGEIRPTQAAAFPGLVINIECQDPAAFPCLPHYEAAARLRETVLSTSIVLGFPYADVAEMGTAAIAPPPNRMWMRLPRASGRLATRFALRFSASRRRSIAPRPWPAPSVCSTWATTWAVARRPMAWRWPGRSCGTVWRRVLRACAMRPLRRRRRPRAWERGCGWRSEAMRRSGRATKSRSRSTRSGG
jgi:microcystin degradation protein MlrC